MIKNFSFLIICVILLSSIAFADCVESCVSAAGCAVPQSNEFFTCRDERLKCQVECGEKKADIQYEDDDVLFTGTKIQNGNTTIMQGQKIGADPSAFGNLRPEDLALFEKNVATSTNGSGSVSQSESTSQSGLLFGSREEKNQETTLQPGVTVSSRKRE